MNETVMVVHRDKKNIFWVMSFLKSVGAGSLNNLVYILLLNICLYFTIRTFVFYVFQKGNV